MSLRRAVADKWLEEEPYSDYRYNVERCANGARVYLIRPTFLNKGFDFQVNIEGLVKVLKPARGLTREMPSHADVIHDLQSKVAAHPEAVAILFEAVVAVYDCAEPGDVLGSAPQLAGLQVGWPIDQTLFALKWLFIEQDITYWAWRGRDMLASSIETKVFGVALAPGASVTAEGNS